MCKFVEITTADGSNVLLNTFSIYIICPATYDQQLGQRSCAKYEEDVMTCITMLDASSRKTLVYAVETYEQIKAMLM